MNSMTQRLGFVREHRWCFCGAALCWYVGSGCNPPDLTMVQFSTMEDCVKNNLAMWPKPPEDTSRKEDAGVSQEEPGLSVEGGSVRSSLHRLFRLSLSELFADRPAVHRSARDGASSIGVEVDASVDDGESVASSNDFAIDSATSVFMAADGDDRDDGLTPETAVRTLSRIQEVLAIRRMQQDVRVVIAPGLYVGQTVVWTYVDSRYEINFVSSVYQSGKPVVGVAEWPIFDGAGEDMLLQLDVGAGQATHLGFFGVHIRGYATMGIHFRGNREDEEAGWNGSNQVVECLFTDIGSLANGGEGGFGALDFVNSRNNRVVGNLFRAIENATESAGRLHAVYLAHFSSGNEVRDNVFLRVSGDPVRMRDDSSFNLITDNVFDMSGVAAPVSEWWCNREQNPNCTKLAAECPSWQNTVQNNQIGCAYLTAPMPVFSVLVEDVNWPADCVDHTESDGWQRAVVANNVETCE